MISLSIQKVLMYVHIDYKNSLATVEYTRLRTMGMEEKAEQYLEENDKQLDIFEQNYVNFTTTGIEEVGAGRVVDLVIPTITIEDSEGLPLTLYKVNTDDGLEYFHSPAKSRLVGPMSKHLIDGLDHKQLKKIFKEAVEGLNLESMRLVQ
jgi:hypothetical protein